MTSVSNTDKEFWANVSASVDRSPSASVQPNLLTDDNLHDARMPDADNRPDADGGEPMKSEEQETNNLTPNNDHDAHAFQPMRGVEEFKEELISDNNSEGKEPPDGNEGDVPTQDADATDIQRLKQQVHASHPSWMMSCLLPTPQGMYTSRVLYKCAAANQAQT